MLYQQGQYTQVSSAFLKFSLVFCTDLLSFLSPPSFLGVFELNREQTSERFSQQTYTAVAFFWFSVLAARRHCLLVGLVRDLVLYLSWVKISVMLVRKEKLELNLFIEQSALRRKKCKFSWTHSYKYYFLRTLVHSSGKSCSQEKQIHWKLGFFDTYVLSK